MKEFLDKLGVKSTGTMTPDKNLVVDLDGADEYDKVFSRFDKSSLIEEQEDLSLAHEDASNIVYVSDEYMINLIADFDNDIYQIVVSKLEKEDN